MFSKSLFKQSCKANGTMWLIITVAVCFMLTCVMLISGRDDVSATKDAIEDTIIESELKAVIQNEAVYWYDVAESGLEHFDEKFLSEFTTSYLAAVLTGKSQDEAKERASTKAYEAAAKDLEEVYVPQVTDELGYEEGSEDADEVKGVIFYTLNPPEEDGSHMFDDFFEENGEELRHYEDILATINEAGHADERERYAMYQTAAFLAGHMVEEDSIQSILENLSDYGVTLEQYESYGYTDYENIKEIQISAIVNYRADLEYRLEHIKEGETVEGIKAELREEVTHSLLNSLPEEVSTALDEVGTMDLYGGLVGSIFYKMAGLLLPIIYMIMTANALIAGQVDSGSMAYILSSSTKRNAVTFTQAVYLAGSLLLMFLCTTVTSVICLNLVDVNTGLDLQKLLLLNLGAYLVMFAMSGFCFLTSCWFDRSKDAMGLGGGVSMFFLVATMLGLFGSPILPAIIRMEPLNYFNYVSLITLFDPVSILEGTDAYLMKFGILAIIGLVCYIIGSLRFRHKDLPL